MLGVRHNVSRKVQDNSGPLTHLTRLILDVITHCRPPVEPLSEHFEILYAVKLLAPFDVLKLASAVTNTDLEGQGAGEKPTLCSRSRLVKRTTNTKGHTGGLG